jgi:formamidopyrimidine-DNA glycosylase
VPELPEVETVCRTLAPLLIGKAFSSFELSWPRTLSRPDLTTFLDAIRGQHILAVERRAKLITMRLENNGMLTVHLRMTGELRWRGSGSTQVDLDPRADYLRAAFLLDDGSELLFYDVRKFGRIAFLTAAQAEEMERAYGIEPLDPSFTPEWLHQNLNRRKRQLKPLLLDQTFIAGLGNIYVDEALFASGLHPLTRSDQVTPDQAERLHAAIVSTLAGALLRRGTTLRDYRSGLGEQGENRGMLQVYGSKSGTPCPRCGKGLERLVVGQRGSVFCPNCQPLASTSDTQSR